MAQFLDEREQPDAGSLSDVRVLARHIFGQNGVEDPRNHVVALHIFNGTEEN